MIWYGLPIGQIKTLRRMMMHPLDFDPISYIEKTLHEPDSHPSKETLILASEFNRLREKLLPSLGQIHSDLASSGPLTLENITAKPKPLEYKLLKTSHSEPLKQALNIKACDGINMQLDRISDSFKINEYHGTKPNEGLHDVIRLYFLSEVLFLLLSKTASATKQGNLIEVRPSSHEVTKQLHRKWFANQWEQNSCAANIAYLDMIPLGFDKHSMFPLVIKELGEKLTDKIFFIPAGELPYKIQSLPSIQWARKLCKLAVLCSWCQIKNKLNYAPNQLISKIGITTDEIQKIEAFSEKQPRPDRVFDVTSKGISIKNPSITIQLRHTINYLANKISDEKLNHEIGMFFEKRCVFDYFTREDIKQNYCAFEGFVPHEIGDQNLNPDVDLIIKDIKRNQYYFTQVKYLRTGGRAYILGDTDHIATDKINKGLRQLTDARLALKEGKLDEILKIKGVYDCTNENSHLLLVHNIFNFDFTIWPQGVISYEWNTLRNVLNNGMIRFDHSQQAVNTWQHANVLPLEDPDQLIKHYIKNSPTQIACSIGTIFDADNVVVQTEINGIEIRCRGLGL